MTQHLSNVKVSDLNKDKGLNVLIDKIKSFYVKDINAIAYMTYDTFENSKQQDEKSMVDYINRFESLNNEILHFDIILPKGVLVNKFLNNTKIISKTKQLKVIYAQVNSLRNL